MFSRKMDWFSFDLWFFTTARKIIPTLYYLLTKIHGLEHRSYPKW